MESLSERALAPESPGAIETWCHRDLVPSGLRRGRPGYKDLSESGHRAVTAVCSHLRATWSSCSGASHGHTDTRVTPADRKSTASKWRRCSAEGIRGREDKKRESTPLPSSTYSSQGDLWQDPGRAAESPAEASTSRTWASPSRPAGAP